MAAPIELADHYRPSRGDAPTGCQESLSATQRARAGSGFLIRPVMGLVAHEMQRVSGLDLVAYPGDLEHQPAFESEDQLLPRMDERLGPTVRAWRDGGHRGRAAEGGVRPRYPLERQALVRSEDSGAIAQPV